MSLFAAGINSGRTERRVNAAWAQNTVDGEEINSVRHPAAVFCLNDGDGGFYLDKACVVSARSARPGPFRQAERRYLSHGSEGKRKLGLQPVPMHDIALHLHKAKSVVEDLPIAITLG